MKKVWYQQKNLQIRIKKVTILVKKNVEIQVKISDNIALYLLIKQSIYKANNSAFCLPCISI